MSDLDQLLRRLERVEERLDRITAGNADRALPAPSPGGHGDTFWALEAQRDRLADHPETIDGAITFTGIVSLPGGPVEWQHSAASERVLDTDWSAHATALAALAHPARLELLRRVLGGASTTAELADESASSGQLHHHLRQLVAAGWLRHSGRGRYEVPPSRVVPLLIIQEASTP